LPVAGCLGRKTVRESAKHALRCFRNLSYGKKRRPRQDQRTAERAKIVYQNCPGQDLNPGLVVLPTDALDLVETPPEILVARWMPRGVRQAVGRAAEVPGYCPNLVHLALESLGVHGYLSDRPGIGWRAILLWEAMRPQGIMLGRSVRQNASGPFGPHASPGDRWRGTIAGPQPLEFGRLDARCQTAEEELF